MEKNLHDIDKLFQNFLEGYEEEPAENVWASIENDLNRTDVKKYKTKYKFLLRGVICVSLLLISLWVTDIIETHHYNLKQNGSSILNSKAKQSSEENNKIKNKNENHTADHIYISASKSHILGTGIESAENKIFQEDKFYNHNQIQLLDSVLIFNKKNKFLMPENLSEINNDPEKWFHFSEHDLGKNLIDNEQQNKQERQAKHQKSKHDLFIIPFFSYDIVTAHLQEQYKYDNQDQLDVSKREKPDPSFSFGLLAEYRLSKKFSLQTGISLSSSFTSIDSTTVRAMPDNSGTYKFKLATTYGFAEIKKTGVNPQNGNSIRLNDASLNLQYVSIPLIVKYKIKPGSFSISGLAGIGINRIVNEKMEVEYASNTNTEMEVVEKIEGLKKTFITFIAGAEAGYNINKRISIGLSESIRYSLTPVNQGTPVKTFPVSIGTAALVKIKL